METSNIFEIPESTPPRRSKRYFVIPATILLVAAIAAGVVWLWSLERAETAPIRTSDVFLKHLLSGESDKAYELTSESFRLITTKEDLSTISGRVKDSLKYDTRQIQQGSRTEEDDVKRADINYEIEGEDGKYNLQVRLVTEEEGKVWKVSGVDSTKQ